MATLAEIEAAIAKAEANGRKDLADQLRARLPEASDAPPDQARVDAAIAKAEAAGRKDLADKLRAAAPAAAVPAAPAAAVPAAPATPAGYSDVAVPPRAEDPAVTAANNLAAFEAANPVLKGRYTAETLPKAGETVSLGKFGKGGYAVKPWRPQDMREDSFGETASAMMEGPIAAMGAFGGGLTGANPSPSREYLANDPLTGGLPSPVLDTLGAFGDVGGAALSTIGAGVSGLIGLGVEAVPGQDSGSERKLAEDLTGMSMFAVPELAGASSIAGRIATAAPKVAPAAKAAVKALPEGVDGADRFGIPVMRSDVKPPSTFIGKTAQKAGEMVPLAGTSGMRAKQAAARVDAVKDFVAEYVGDRVMPAIDAVTEDFRKLHADSVKKYAAQKKDVIKSMDASGPVPVPKAIAAIDEQIAKLKAAKNEGFDPVISELENFKASITDQKMTEIDMNRAYIGKVFSGLDAAKIKDAGEKALSAVYGPLKDDMGAFIKKFGGTTALNKWGAANEKLTGLADGMENAALKRALKTGEMTPEVTRQLLFSQKPSDVRLLHSRLNEEGRKAARAAVVQEAVAKAGGIDAMTPDKFKTALGRLGGQIGVFFKGDDLEAATGLVKALRLTERGARAADMTPTGMTALPYVATLGLGSALGLVPGAATAGAIGIIARIYESTGVRSALKAVNQAKPGPAQATAMQKLESAISASGLPIAGQAANSTPDYETLWGRYGQ